MAKYLLPFIFILLGISGASAQTTCPLGQAADPAPGKCSLYVDKNGNDFCDLSESQAYGQTGTKKALSEEELKRLTVAEAAAYFGISPADYAQSLSGYVKKEVSPGDSLQTLHDQSGLCAGVAASLANGVKEGKGTEELDPLDLIPGSEINSKKVYEVAALYKIDENKLANALADYLGVKVKLGDTIQLFHDNNGLEASKVKELAKSIVLSSGTAATEPIAEAEASSLPESQVPTPRYQLVLITIITMLLYWLTHFLSAKKKISVLAHRRIWNLVLLLSFLISGVFGILLIIRINWGWYLTLPFNILYWHVEIGTVMFLVSLFHIAWHVGYFRTMFFGNK